MAGHHRDDENKPRTDMNKFGEVVGMDYFRIILDGCDLDTEKGIKNAMKEILVKSTNCVNEGDRAAEKIANGGLTLTRILKEILQVAKLDMDAKIAELEGQVEKLSAFIEDRMGKQA